MYKKNIDISVNSGSKWVENSPRMLWGTESPNSQDFINGLEKHLRYFKCKEIKKTRLNNWFFIGSKFDWIESGLDGVRTEAGLFNKMFRYSDSDGAIGLRLEFPIRIYADNVILWRNNSLNLIKGKANNNIIEFIKDNYHDYVALAFKVNE